MSSGRLDGKRVFLTGAGGGLVAAIARAFTAEGAAQVLAGRTLERVEAVASGLERTEAVQLDVADSAAVEAAVGAAHERMGGLDVVVNGAAIDTGWAPSADMELGVWDSHDRHQPLRHLLHLPGRDPADGRPEAAARSSTSPRSPATRRGPRTSPTTRRRPACTR